jgi:hypothetical protein
MARKYSKGHKQVKCYADGGSVEVDPKNPPRRPPKKREMPEYKPKRVRSPITGR